MEVIIQILAEVEIAVKMEASGDVEALRAGELHSRSEVNLVKPGSSSSRLLSLSTFSFPGFLFLGQLSHSSVLGGINNDKSYVSC